MLVNYSLPQNERHQIAVLLDPKQQLPDSDRSNNYVIADFVAPNNSTAESQAVISPSDFIDEFDEYQTTPVSAETKAQIEAGVNVSTNVNTTNAAAFPDTQ